MGATHGKQNPKNLSPEGVEQKLKIMSSYRQILYHIIFRTKNSLKTLAIDHSDELYAYLSGIIKKKGCFPYQINGIEDHIHILSDLQPSVALADFMRDLKTSSSIWLKASPKFPDFES